MDNNVFPYNLLKEIGRIRSTEFLENIYEANCEILDETEITFPADFIASFWYVLYSLSDREREIIICRYRDGMTLEDTGKRFNLTRERIRQIEARTIRKLKHPVRQQYIRNGVIGMTEIRAKALMSQQLVSVRSDSFREGYEACRKEWLASIEAEQKRNIENPVKPVSKSYNLLDGKTKIEDLDLSVRSYNCLKRARVDTVEQLAALSVNKLMRIRNLGRTSLNEIVSKMENAGYIIQQYAEDEIV